MPALPDLDDRRDPPELPSGRIDIQPPPDLGAVEGVGGSLASSLPMLAGVGSMLLLGGLGGQGAPARRSMIAAAALLLTTVAFVALQLDRQRAVRARRIRRLRAGYRAHLREVRADVHSAAAQQRLALSWRHPEPSALPCLVTGDLSDHRRSPGDPRFLHVRYGISTQPLCVELSVPPIQRHGSLDPASMAALDRLLGVHRLQVGLPATLDLSCHAEVHIDGPAGRARSLARAIICSAVATHDPEHLQIAALVAPERLEDWEWLKWLPHHGSRLVSDVAGPQRMLAADADMVDALLPRGGGAHLLVIEDGAPVLPGRGLTAHTVLRLDAGPAPAGGVTLRFTGTDALVVLDEAAPNLCGEGDRCEPAIAEALARRLAGRDTAGHRIEPPCEEHLVATIGSGDDGPVRLDLKESAAGGDGPHGLMVGATGSGKSELLRTLVLRLAENHTPDELNLALVDFKGGATFAGLATLPHVSALITNLADDPSLIDRMQDALGGELVRRQLLLRQAGGFASAQEYHAARGRDVELAPLPTLVVVVDEFSELLAARPDFIDVLASIGRLGRSLGLHLLLASQRVEEGRLRGLESHLSYRIALRTFSAADSQAVLGGPQAWELPAVPGWGLLQTKGGELMRFRSAYVSGPAPCRPRMPAEAVPFTSAAIPSPSSDVPGVVPTTLEAAVSEIRLRAGPTSPLWLPPLGAPETLGALLEQEPRGRALTATIGMLDRPREQRRSVLQVDLTLGHLAIVGGPRSGKSTTLATLVASLALTSSPEEAQVYILDLGGATFARLTDLPQVAAVATRAAPDVVRRVVAEIEELLDSREGHFARAQIDSPDDYRRRRALGDPGDGFGDVFLVVDGWGALRGEFEDVEPRLQDWATRGSSFGMHLVVASTRWTDFRPTTRDLFGHRLELRLGDPLDSEIDRARAARVPERTPGRGLCADGLEFRAALPRLDAEADTASLGAGVADLVVRARAAWRGRTARRLRLLPANIDLQAVRGQAPGGSGRLLLGLAEPDLAPIGLDLESDPHLLVFGDAGSGRTNLLRVLCREISRTRGPHRAQVLLLDPRRGLLGELSAEQVLAHHANGAAAAAAADELAAHLTSRLPGPTVTSEQIRARDWWTGAEVFVVVDDYELLAQPVSPLSALVPLLPHAHDVGLHLILARRAGGAGRALYEPVLQGLRELGTLGVLLSGSPDEGPLLGGVRPEPAPAGRGRLITRGQTVRSIQVAHITPAP